MRRLLALIPAVMLVFALAPAAQAHEEVKTTPCHPDISTSGMTGVVDASDSGRRTDRNHRIFLLQRITVTNDCGEHWAALTTFQTVDADPQRLFVVVAPGVTHTFGHQALAKAGIWQHPYTNWSVQTPSWATSTPCHSNWTDGPWLVVWVLPDGRLSTSPPPECVTG